MMNVPPQKVYENLDLLERVDTTTSATYRELAQEALADTDISLNWRDAIADRLNEANQLLGIQTAGGKDDSY